MRKLFSVLLLGIALIARAADVYPSFMPPVQANVYTGVIGGADTKSDSYTKYGSTITATGSDESTTINTAITNANAAATSSAGKYVLLGAGVHLHSSPIQLKPYVELRGADRATTTLEYTGTGAPAPTAILMGLDGDYPQDPPTGIALTANAAAGATTITVSSGATFSVGSLIALSQDNLTQAAMEADPSEIQIKDDGAKLRMVRQLTRVTAKSGNDLTIFPATYFALTTARTAHARVIGGGSYDYVGLRGLTLKWPSSTTGTQLKMWQNYGSWILDCRFQQPSNYSVYLFLSLNCEVRHNKFDDLQGSGTNHSTILGEYTSASLISNNGFGEATPQMEYNYAWLGNAVFGNYADKTIIIDGAEWDTTVAYYINHGPHNSYNVYEANFGSGIRSDGYFGGSSKDFIFRNCLTSYSTGTTAGGTLVKPISWNRFTRMNYSYLNLIGKSGKSIASYEQGSPNIGGGAGTGTASLSAADPWADWFTTPGTTGYVETDLDVAIYCVFGGNYSMYSASTIESIGTGTAPASYVYPTKPTWWGDRPWPAFDTTVHSDDPLNLPSGYEYINGVPPPGGGSATMSSGLSGGVKLSGQVKLN